MKLDEQLWDVFLICLVLQDPLAWSDVTSFDLSEGGRSPKPINPSGACPNLERTAENLGYPINPPTVPEMGRQCAVVNQSKCAPLSNPCTNRFSSPPPSIMRKKRRERGDQSPADDRKCGFFVEISGLSPKSTPVKGRPFSPSQVTTWFSSFFQRMCSLEVETQTCVDPFTVVFQCIWWWTLEPGQSCPYIHPGVWTEVSAQHTPAERDHAETPEGKCRVRLWLILSFKPSVLKSNSKFIVFSCLRSFRTPKIHRNVMVHTPRTPTPFKNALAAQEKMHGPLKIVVCCKTPVRNVS